MASSSERMVENEGQNEHQCEKSEQQEVYYPRSAHINQTMVTKLIYYHIAK